MTYLQKEFPQDAEFIQMVGWSLEGFDEARHGDSFVWTCPVYIMGLECMQRGCTQSISCDEVRSSKASKVLYIRVFFNSKRTARNKDGYTDQPCASRSQGFTKWKRVAHHMTIIDLGWHRPWEGYKILGNLRLDFSQLLTLRPM
jgi:hypothetical protein